VGPPEDFQGRTTAPRCTLGVTPFDYAVLVLATVLRVDLWLLRMPRAKVTAHVEAQRNLDRWEADLLLNVVFAHMAFRSTEDYSGRKVAHDRFRQAVGLLYQFVTTEDSDEDTAMAT
jgi:hypothetical protein